MSWTVPGFSEQIHAYHQSAMPQTENGCAAFALACLVRGLGFDRWGDREVDPHLAAYLAGMVALDDAYPRDADPGTAWQAEWGFERRYAYPLRRTIDLAQVGTAPSGAAAALDALTGGSWTAIPVKGRRRDGGPLREDDLWALVDVVLGEEASHGAQLLFNYQTGPLASLTGWGQGWGALLFDEPQTGCEWDVGHVTSLAGVVSAPTGERALVIRDSSPRFGWRGYHAERAGPLTAALARDDGAEGGILVLCRAALRPVVEDLLGWRLPGCALEMWDNGSRFEPPAPL